MSEIDRATDYFEEGKDMRGPWLLGAMRHAKITANTAGKIFMGAMGGAGATFLGAMAVSMIGYETEHPIGMRLAGEIAADAGLALLAAAASVKALQMVAESKIRKMRPVVADIGRGLGTQAAIDLHLGDKMAAKLGGWRHEARQAQAAPAAGAPKPKA